MTDNVHAESKAEAIFAGGCFWCMESPFEKLDGVYEAIAGYSGGKTENPTYEEIGTGITGHYEVVKVVYNPDKISYQKLLETFWQQIDPTDAGGQFADRGTQYQAAIFYNSDEQRRLAEESKALLEASGLFDKPIATEILPAKTFYAAEAYHQDYYKTNTAHYQMYRKGSGRAKFIEENWQGKANTCFNPKPKTQDLVKQAFAKPNEKELKSKLSSLQYEVTQNDATEPPFKNEFWDNKKPGIYVDVVSGEPLFSSLDKYDSGSGWPSFTKPLVSENISTKEDRKLFVPRTEVRSKGGNSHLGHVFDDGPGPNGLRYCINSASLRFIPVEDLEKEGYGEWLKLFK